MAYSSIYIPKLRYILPSASFTIAQVKNINAKLNSYLLPLLHINYKTPKSVVNGPISHGGIGLVNIYNLQGYLQTSLVLQIIRQNLPSKPLLIICIHQLQLEIGSEKLVLQNPIPTKNYTSASWITKWWSYLSMNNLTFHNFPTWNIHHQRVNDQHIMDTLIDHFSTTNLKTINLCRLYLHVALLSDITEPDGKSIRKNIKHQPVPYDSIIGWPNIPHPTTKAWKTWKKAIQYIEDYILVSPLGS